jgi:hypothetical protein
MSIVNLEQYKRELACAEAMGRLERPAYWEAFKRGLQRAFFGESAVSTVEHRAWLDLVDRGDPSSCERGAGYRDGYAMGIEATGGMEE